MVSTMTGLAVQTITFRFITRKIILFQILLECVQRPAFYRLWQLVPGNGKTRFSVMGKCWSIHPELLHIMSRITSDSVNNLIRLQRFDNT